MHNVYIKPFLYYADIILPTSVVLKLEDDQVSILPWSISVDYFRSVSILTESHIWNYSREDEIIHFNLSNESVRINISVCDHSLEFIIGKIVFHIM